MLQGRENKCHFLCTNVEIETRSMIPGLLMTKAELEPSSLLPDSNGAQKQSPPQPHEERRNLSPCLPLFRRSGRLGLSSFACLGLSLPITKIKSLDPSLPPSSDALELTGKKMARRVLMPRKRGLCVPTLSLPPLP